jgi:hypothetical protein
VIEQLPDAHQALRQNTEAEIDLYEQGMERLITFSPMEENVMIRCESRTEWVPVPDVIYGSRQEVDHLFATLAHEFVVALRRASPTLAALPAFADWA